MKVKRALGVLAIALVLQAVIGCNIFDWSSGESVQSLIDEGRQYMQDGDYGAAADKFAQAMERDPNSAEARYMHAKAIIHGSGFDLVDLVDLVDDVSNFFDLGDNIFADWSTADKNSLYQAVRIAYDDLLPIQDGETHGAYGPDDISREMLALSFIRLQLVFLDRNGNGIIEDNESPSRNPQTERVR
jgi:hypothetical protein